MLKSLSVQQAAKKLADGAVVAYPTEAVWGLGCDPNNESAFKKILQLKQRPIEKGVILLFASVEQAEQMLSFSPEQREMLLSPTKRPTTYIVDGNGKIPSWITGQFKTVAIRITKHPIARLLCERFGGGLVSTSANLAGQSEAKDLEALECYFGEQDLFYCEGDLGGELRPSKIIELATGRVLRD